MVRLFAFSTAVLMVAQVAMADPSVVDAYREVQKAAPDLTYDLAQSSNGWVTVSPDWGTPMPVTLDGKNGFIEILDEGTGGGSLVTQIVLWRMADGEALLGVGETSYDPPYPGNTRVRFFGRDGGEGSGWSEWTQGVWSAPALSDFLPDTALIGDLRALKAVGATVHVVLPRKGVNPEARLITPDERINAVCSGADWFVPADPAAFLTYCKRVQNQVLRQMNVIWDKPNYQFRLGEAR